MRIAVIGSGPAAVGTCLGLLAGKTTSNDEIVVLDIGRQLFNPNMLVHPNKWPKSIIPDIHQKVKVHTKGWIPEKSYFGHLPEKYSNQKSIYKSDVFGGLSKFWGASFLPFSEIDLQEWPISLADMNTYYKAILDEVKVTGADDSLNLYFSPEFTNEHPIKVPSVIQKLEKSINSGKKNSETRFIVGSPRLSLSTNSENSCTFCGHCFYGCYNNSIYTADQTIQRLEAKGLIKYHSGKKVLSFKKLSDGKIELEIKSLSSSQIEMISFDKVFIGAGCIESTRLIANSLDLEGEQFPIVENPMFHVPIAYTGSLDPDNMTNIVALNNLLIGRLPSELIEKYIHMQIYPLNSYLWNHALSKGLGKIGMKFTSVFQKNIGKRVLIMLFYLHGDYTIGSTVSFSGDSQNIRFKNQVEASSQARVLVDELSELLRGSGFHVLKPLLKCLPSGGSYHYAGTMPMGGSQIPMDQSCSPLDNVYLSDSSTFPTLPAQNHSFTIMANAYRVAIQAVNE